MQLVLSFEQLLGVYEDLCDLQAKGLLSAPMGPWRADGTHLCQSTLGALVPSFGIDRYPSIEEKAARIMCGIVCGHPLVDGIDDDDLIDMTYHVMEARTDKVSVPRISSVVASRFMDALVPL